MTNIDFGDLLLIDISEEAREWGYNPATNGTVVQVVGFSEIAYGHLDNCCQRPGVYRNRCYPTVRLPDGETINISCCYLKSADPESVKGRNLGERDNWLRPLPDTEFYPDDQVERIGGFGSRYQGKIARIDYNCIDRKRDNGGSWPFYTVDLELGGQMSFEEGHLRLVKRGNIWKLLNGEQPEFSSLEEEARFEMRRGKYEEVRNPASNLYCWEKDEVLDAIRRGEVHGMSLSGGLFGTGVRPYAIKFYNESLGKRVAKETLEGFSI